MNEVVPLSKDFDALKKRLEGKQGEPSPKGDNRKHDQGKEGRRFRERVDDSLITPLANQEVEVHLRNGQSLTGVLRKASRFELYFETPTERLILMKHAVDLIIVATTQKSKVERLITEIPG